MEAVLSHAWRPMTRPAPSVRSNGYHRPRRHGACVIRWSGYGRTVTRLTSPYSPCRERSSSRWTNSDPAWNRDLEITQGEACGDHHGEAAGDEPPALIPDSPPPVTDSEALSDGFMVMSTALNNSYHDCDLVLQAESLVIAKEHIVDEYGPIDFTVGNGCSGGSLSQNQVANAYPGIYQGLITSCTFPDAFSTNMDVVDCDLFLRYWGSPGVANSGLHWTAAQEAAAAGKQSTKVCNSLDRPVSVLSHAAADHGAAIGR